jgi:hypothetical protein
VEFVGCEFNAENLKPESSSGVNLPDIIRINWTDMIIIPQDIPVKMKAG